jgi:hypothetical protein
MGLGGAAAGQRAGGLRVDLPAAEILPHDEVDHPGDRLAAVDGRGAVGGRFDAIDGRPGPTVRSFLQGEASENRSDPPAMVAIML